jgi:ribosomal protein S18 acetylase RimI-like enzyme
MNITFIQATPADSDYLLALRKLTMVPHLEAANLFLSDQEHIIRLNDAYDCSYLIMAADKRVGTIKYRVLENTFEIMQIQIHPNFQRQGLGKKVMKKVLDSTTKTVELTVLKANPAKALYQRLGFVVTGEDDYEFHMMLKR